MTDLALAARALRHSPGHAALVAGCLAIGLAVNILAFSLVHALMYGELPGITSRMTIARIALQYEGVLGAETVAGRVVAAGPLTRRDFEAFASSLPASLSAVAAEGRGRVTMAVDGIRQSVPAAYVSTDYFDTLGTTAAKGRLLNAADRLPGAIPVAVIGHYFWTDRMGMRADVVGSPISVNGRQYTVVGVAPRGFAGMQLRDVGEPAMSGTQIWVPLPEEPADTRPWLEVFGRMATGTRASELDAALGPAAARIEAAGAGTRRQAVLVARSFGLDPSERPGMAVLAILLFMSIPLCVLGIAAANVINLQLARTTERSRALIVRLALGATPRQAMRWLLYETAMLSAVAVSAGLLLTRVAVQLGADLVPFPLELNTTVVTVALMLTVAVSLLATWIPARVTMTRLSITGHATASPGHVRLRHSLVVTQVALSVALVLIAHLSLRSMQTIRQTAPAGASQVRFSRISFDDGVPASEQVTAVTALVEQLLARPDLAGVGQSNDSPLGGPVRYWLPNDEPAMRRTATGSTATPGWLQTLGATVVAGRLFEEKASSAAVVSEAMAARLAGDPSRAVGLSLRVQASSMPTPQTVDVVGVFRDPIRQADGQPRESLFIAGAGGTTLSTRARHAGGLQPELQHMARAISPRMTLTPMTSLADAIAMQAGEGALVGSTFGVLGSVASSLAFLGLVAVMTYLVRLRSRELAIRSALGARPGDLVRLVVGHAARLVGSGTMAGLAIGVALATAMRSQLTGVSPFDPISVLLTCAGFGVIGLAAAAWPARRASRTHPATLLRW